MWECFAAAAVLPRCVVCLPASSAAMASSASAPSTASTSLDGAFAGVLSQVTPAGGPAAEWAFVEAFFGFLSRHTSALSSAAAVERLRGLAQLRPSPPAERKEREGEGEGKEGEGKAAEQKPLATPAPAVGAAAGGGGAEAERSPSGLLPPVQRGSSTALYSWTQSLSEVTVTLPPLPLSTSSRALAVELTPTQLSIAYRGPPQSAPPPLLPPGRFHAAIQSDDSTWTLETEGSAKLLRLYLKKAKGMEWWPRLLEGEPQIDVARIEPENSQLSDLDSDTRATVEKMMDEQRRKAQMEAGGGMGGGGLSEDGKEAALKRFMAQHPEMDFSSARIM